MCKCGTFSGAAMNMLSSKVVFTGHGNSTSNTTIDWAYFPAKNPTPKSQNTKKLNQCPFILPIQESMQCPVKRRAGKSQPLHNTTNVKAMGQLLFKRPGMAWKTRKGKCAVAKAPTRRPNVLVDFLTSMKESPFSLTQPGVVLFSLFACCREI